MREALRYLRNAKEKLRSVPIEDNTYTDVNPVREAFGIAYLAVLEAINEYLLKKGLTKKELPKWVDAYRTVLPLPCLTPIPPIPSIQRAKVIRHMKR